MKIIVAGGREFNDEAYMLKVLENLMVKGLLGEGDPELVCGMALGADSIAKDIFESSELTVHERPADWEDMSLPCVRKVNRFGKVYNALAGMKRNHSMGDEADKLIAFWDGVSTGTDDMIKYMKKLGKPVHIYRY